MRTVKPAQGPKGRGSLSPLPCLPTGRSPSSGGLSRRTFLAATGATSLVLLAGCRGGGGHPGDKARIVTIDTSPLMWQTWFGDGAQVVNLLRFHAL